MLTCALDSLLLPYSGQHTSSTVNILQRKPQYLGILYQNPLDIVVY